MRSTHLELTSINIISLHQSWLEAERSDLLIHPMLGLEYHP